MSARGGSLAGIYAARDALAAHLSAKGCAAVVVVDLSGRGKLWVHARFWDRLAVESLRLGEWRGWRVDTAPL